MNASDARRIADKAPLEDRVMEAIRIAATLEQYGTRVPKRWIDPLLLIKLRSEGYTVTEGWYEAYEPGWIIKWLP